MVISSAVQVALIEWMITLNGPDLYVLGFDMISGVAVGVKEESELLFISFHFYFLLF